MAVNTEIPDAQKKWDSDTVIKLGLRTVSDFELCEWASASRADALSTNLHEHLARAHSRKGIFERAAHHYERASLSCERTEDFRRTGTLLSNKGHAILPGYVRRGPGHARTSRAPR